VPVVRLTEVFRQAAGSEIILAAHRIREGRMPETRRAPESDFHFVEREDPEPMAAMLNNWYRNGSRASFAWMRSGMSGPVPQDPTSTRRLIRSSRFKQTVQPELFGTGPRFALQPAACLLLAMTRYLFRIGTLALPAAAFAPTM